MEEYFIFLKTKNINNCNCYLSNENLINILENINLKFKTETIKKYYPNCIRLSCSFTNHIQSINFIKYFALWISITYYLDKKRFYWKGISWIC
jgi:predicted RNA-binding protein with EMAP domain